MKTQTRIKNLKRILYTAFAFFAVFWLCVTVFAGCFFADDNTPFTNAWQAGELKMHFVDVGQGDCTLIELPDGKTLMIDGGDGTEENNQKILSYLKALHISKLDYLILTHADEDHYGGLESVVNAVNVASAYFPCEATLSSGAGYLSLYQTALIKIPKLNIFRRYHYIRGENYFLIFLWPYGTELDDRSDTNYSSAVVWLDYLGINALFTGDMTSAVEETLLNEYFLIDGIFDFDGMQVNLESTEILKVAHHGSNSSSSLLWLQTLQFKTAVISCGKGNSYNHPSSTVLQNLRQANPQCEIYRTDDCGDIVITATQTQYVTAYRNQKNTREAENVNKLLHLAYVQRELFYTENVLL